ncbi:hypothetical protein VTL71DRAFT_15627 [Oculimacula yallundae]|uniref:GST N-terminal domain-containing protein n=1 Tax=Oculimacula yallundae TaxID=86028 RepID=A0ABR4CJH5_9HELO
MEVTLHILPGALYTRRVLIYLHEKDILQHIQISPALSSHSMPSKAYPRTHTTQSTIPKPKGTLPALTLPDGAVIHDSLAIINHLEDLCDTRQRPPSSYSPDRAVEAILGSSNPTKARPSLRGQTSEEQIRNRDITALADEATTLFEQAARHGSSMFVLLQRQDIALSKTALKACRATLGSINKYYIHDPRYGLGEDNDVTAHFEVTIADCVLFSLLQFTKCMYSVDLTDGMAGLERFYEVFEKRESVCVEGPEGEVWDEHLRMLASCWVGETEGVWGWVAERVRICGVYGKVVGGMAGKALMAWIG